MSCSLARKLVAVLNATLPDDVALAVRPDGGINIVAGAEPVGRVEMYPYPMWPGEPPDSYARTVLTEVQEQMLEWVVGHDWPEFPPEVPVHRPGMTREPNAEVVNNVLHWWYGDRDRPLLVLPPVPLDDVALGG